MFGKIAAIVVTVGGVAGGMAATGGFGTLGQAGVSAAPLSAAGAGSTALPGAEGVPLNFPDLPQFQEVSAQPGQEQATAATARALAIAAQAEGSARQAAVAAQKCLDSLTAQVQGLVAGIPNITSQQQAAAMVAQARTISQAATACAKQATALGQKGIDQINKAASELNAAVTKIGSLDLQSTADQVVQNAQNTVGNATKAVDQASGSAFGMFKQITDMAAALMATAMDFQNKYQNPVPAPNNPVPTAPGVPAPTTTNPFAQWGDIGSWMTFAAQMAQTYGTESNQSNVNVQTSESSDGNRGPGRWSGR